jgi:hypothetical protein
MTNTTSDTARASDVNDLANVAEEASVDPPSENVRSIRPDIDNARARTKQETEKVTSERQKAANRANARHSTGPKTPEGKAVVRTNALRHGLLTRDVVLPEEDAEAFEILRNRVWANFSPVGPMEEFQLDRVVNAMWRLRRLERAETALFHSRMQALKADRLAIQVREMRLNLDYPLPQVVRDNAVSEASEARKRAEYERDCDEVLLGRAIDADAKEGDAFGKLARYERSLERSLHRALSELRRMQDERRYHNSITIAAQGIFGLNPARNPAAQSPGARGLGATHQPAPRKTARCDPIAAS